MSKSDRQPTFYIPHGGGPCFFMHDPRGRWIGMAQFLRSIAGTLPEQPKAILVISGHWETSGFGLTASEKPNLIYDYSGFPKPTYELRYDAPGSPELARRATQRLTDAGFTAFEEAERGLDHGVFIPLKVAFPDADIPVVEMSLDRSLDPGLHLDAGRALAPLRDEGVLLLGTGMSFHNMRGYGDPRFTPPSEAFDDWLTETVLSEPRLREDRLRAWARSPAARVCHPREEHLIPLMVVAGAAGKAAQRIYSERVLETAISAYEFT